MSTITVDVDVDLSDFNDKDVIEYAKELGMVPGVHSAMPDVTILGYKAYIAIIEKNEAQEKAICREIIEAITGKII